MHVEFCLENLKGNLGINGRIVSEWFMVKWSVSVRTQLDKKRVKWQHHMNMVMNLRPTSFGLFKSG
jgi:hypothetical protein